MLDIAEHVFQLIAQRLKNLNKSVRECFEGVSQIVDFEYEGEQNVEIIPAEEFLQIIKELGIADLGDLEIACLMRVLSKPELNHAVTMYELQMVMANFGIEVDPNDEED